MSKHATALEREYMGAVASLCCVVCRNLDLGDTPAVVHHIREGQGGAQRAANFLTLPLCPEHHVGSSGYHHNPRRFEAMHGSELDLLGQTIGEVFALKTRR